MSDALFTPFDGKASGMAAFRAWPGAEGIGLASQPVDEFARGFAEGQSLAEAAFAQERAALQALVASAQALQPVEPQAVRQLILESVERLVSEIVGKAPVEREWLIQQVEGVVQLAGQVEGRKLLWLNPADMALLEGAELGLELRADAEIMPGSLRLELESGWIEHGRMVMLEALRSGIGTEAEQ